LGNPTLGIGAAEISERGCLLSFFSRLRTAQPGILLPARSRQTPITWLQ
jgi:hypothetical protein